MRYFDTGVLLKLYLPEPPAAEAVRADVKSANHGEPCFQPAAFVKGNESRPKARLSGIPNRVLRIDRPSPSRPHRGRGKGDGFLAGCLRHSRSPFRHSRCRNTMPLVGHTACRSGVGTWSHGVLHLRPAPITHGRRRRLECHFLIFLHENQPPILVSRDLSSENVEMRH